MNKELRKTLKELRAEGFTTTTGKSHIKVFDPAGRFACALSHGNNRDKVPGGSDKELRRVLKKWKEEH